MAIKREENPYRAFCQIMCACIITSFSNAEFFAKSPERVAAIAMVMGLRLLVYSLGQRCLRQALVRAGESINNQLGQGTQRPTLCWIFQCFQDVHLLIVAGVTQHLNSLFSISKKIFTDES